MEEQALKDIDKILQAGKKIHFIGIGGAGMCPIAEIMLTKGYTLTGSDIDAKKDTVKRLISKGATVFIGQKPENIADDVDFVIYTNGILKNNTELAYAKENFPCFERAELLGALSRMYDNTVGVCGTHGKTTTTSMITQIFMESDLDPSAVIGGKLAKIDAYGRSGKSENFVVESCEFNNTFLHMSPNTSVFLNVDEDHLEFFGDLNGIKKSFKEFAQLTRTTIIYNGDDENTIDTLKDIKGKRMTSVGANDGNEWQTINHNVMAFNSEYDICHNGEFVAHIVLSVPGKHNIENSALAFVTAYENGAKVDSILKGLKEFKGASRRFEKMGEYCGVTFVDDYAHNPPEINTTITSALGMGYKNVWAIHQPYTFSRTKEFLKEFAEVLSKADKCVISAIKGGREIDDGSVKASDLTDLIPNSIQIDTFEDICDYVCEHVESGDIVLTIGCGNANDLNEMMCKKMKAKEDSQK